MKDLALLMQTEMLKLRRSSILAVALLFPLGLFVVSLLTCLLVVTPQDGASWRGWVTMTLWPWSTFLLPMMSCLLATLMWNMEHQNQQWKQLNALPVARWKHMAAKQLLLAGLVGLGHLLLALCFCLGGFVVQGLRPALSFQNPEPFFALSLLVPVFLATWALLAVHSWLAARFTQLSVNLGLGIVGVVLVGAVQMRPAMARYYPWAMPSLCYGDFVNPQIGSGWAMASVSLGVALVLMALACWDMQKRESVG